MEVKQQICSIFMKAEGKLEQQLRLLENNMIGLWTH